MSKMGQELERKLDENKYELYEALKEVKLVWSGLDLNRTFPHLEEVINKVIAKVEGGKENVY